MEDRAADTGESPATLVNKYAPRDGPPVAVGYSDNQAYFDSLKTPEDRIMEHVRKRLRHAGMGTITDIKIVDE